MTFLTKNWCGEINVYGERLVGEMTIYPVREFYTFREPFYDMFHYLKRELMRVERCYVVGLLV